MRIQKLSCAACCSSSAAADGTAWGMLLLSSNAMDIVPSQERLRCSALYLSELAYIDVPWLGLFLRSQIRKLQESGLLGYLPSLPFRCTPHHSTSHHITSH
jgi:hypothetical protein